MESKLTESVRQRTKNTDMSFLLQNKQKKAAFSVLIVMLRFNF